MAQLPLDQAITRFKANDERIDAFVNGDENTDMTTSDNVDVPSIQKFLAQKDEEINGEANTILSGAQSARDDAVQAKEDAEAAAALTGSASGVTNDSTVAGAKVSDALNTLKGLVDGHTSSLALKAPLASPVFTGLPNFSEGLQLGTLLSPSQITGNQNNYSPTNWATATIVGIYSDAARTITGFAAPTGSASQLKYIFNSGYFDITIANESASSTATNRVYSSDAQDIILKAGQGLTLAYTGTRWTPIARNTGNSVRAPDFQRFDASGTWNKPTGFSPDAMVWVRVWGAGGGGSWNTGAGYNCGGAGGGYIERWVKLSDLSSTISVVVGAGGAGRTTSAGAGAKGNNSGFGGIYAYGGGAGTAVSGQSNNARGGTFASAGANGYGDGSAGNDKRWEQSGTSSWTDIWYCLWAGATAYGAGAAPGCNSWYGGAAGASAISANAQAGGISYGGGGNGGASGYNGVSAAHGQQPGGGGGATWNAGQGGNGGDGRVEVMVFEAL